MWAGRRRRRGWLISTSFAGELNVRGQLQPAKRDRPARWVLLLKSAASARTVPLFPAVTAALVERLSDEQAAGRGADTDLVFCTRTGRPLGQRNVALRGVEKASLRAGLGKVTPQDLRLRFARSPGGVASIPSRRRRSPGTRLRSGRASMPAHSAKRSVTRLATDSSSM